MAEGQTGGPVTKAPDGGMRVAGRRVGPPGLQRPAGHMAGQGGLPQGAPLGVPGVRRVKECRTAGAIPAWLMLMVASGLRLDDRAHNDLLFHPRLCVVMAQDAEGGSLFQLSQG